MDNVNVDSVANKVSLNALWSTVKQYEWTLRFNGSCEAYENYVYSYLEYVNAGGKRVVSYLDDIIKNSCLSLERKL